MSLSPHYIIRGKDDNGEAQFIRTDSDGNITTQTTLKDEYGSSPATPRATIATIDLNKTGIASFTYDLPFYTGLALVTNSTVDLTVIYE